MRRPRGAGDGDQAGGDELALADVEGDGGSRGGGCGGGAEHGASIPPGRSRGEEAGWRRGEAAANGRGEVDRTAIVVLQLAGEGRLSLDDTRRAVAFGADPNSGAISIRQLLNHTSAIFSFDKDPRVLARTART
jgi:D-alanyl-D-alanine carboxypeptidase